MSADEYLANALSSLQFGFILDEIDYFIESGAQMVAAVEHLGPEEAQIMIENFQDVIRKGGEKVIINRKSFSAETVLKMMQVGVASRLEEIRSRDEIMPVEEINKLCSQFTQCFFGENQVGGEDHEPHNEILY